MKRSGRVPFSGIRPERVRCANRAGASGGTRCRNLAGRPGPLPG